MATLVTPADYPAIRLLLGLDEVTLPDLTIAADPFVPAAEQEVADRIGAPLAGLMGDEAVRAKQAAIHLAAAKLAPALAAELSVTRERFADQFEYTRSDRAPSPLERAAGLRAEAERWLEPLLRTVTFASVFQRATGRRGA